MPVCSVGNSGSQTESVRDDYAAYPRKVLVIKMKILFKDFRG